MKSLLIALCAALVACSSAEESEPQVQVDYSIPSPGGGGGGGYYNPCGRVYVIKVPTEAGTYTKEVPIYCNPNGDEYHGDPPDWYRNKTNQVVDPDPWDTHPNINPEIDYNAERRNAD